MVVLRAIDSYSHLDLGVTSKVDHLDQFYVVLLHIYSPYKFFSLFWHTGEYAGFQGDLGLAFNIFLMEEINRTGVDLNGPPFFYQLVQILTGQITGNIQ